ncbi:MAG: flavin reductase family protein [Saprospiraceae bacterium]
MAKIFFPDELSSRDLHQFILSSIIPRPIALVSTIDKNNIANIAPFSYFNAISSLPPILGFSISKKNQLENKDTLNNIIETNECVINMVNYDMTYNMAMTGIPFSADTDEFEKSNLSKVKSQIVKPFGITESPVRFECKLDKLIPFGNETNQTILVVCKVLCFHIQDELIDQDINRIRIDKLDLTGRLGRTNYIKFSSENIFSIELPHHNIPIGYDSLPQHILKSKILTAKELSILASQIDLPEQNTINDIIQNYNIIKIKTSELHNLISKKIQEGLFSDAISLCFIPEEIIDTK